MKRFAEQHLIDWIHSPHRKPLIIRGARQTGKTWLVKQLGEQHFDSIVTVDFEKRRDLHPIFEGTLAPSQIITSLELVYGRIVPEKTLLFFDEVQACPRALMSLRYFYEEMPLQHIIAAGSLIEFALSEISFPVGRVSYLHIHPMTFTEFLIASGKEIMAEEVSKPTVPGNSFIQKEILKELKTYFLVGGMPRSVLVWNATGSFNDVFREQDDLITSYQDDFLKYTPRVNIDCLDAVFRQVPLRVGQQIKYATLDRSFSGVTNRKALELLEKAEIVRRICSTDPSGIPLGAGENSKKFKAAFLDIGLMQRMSGMTVTPDMMGQNLLSLYQGRLAEQFVAQEMTASGMRKLYYWSRDEKSSTAEVDFLISKGTDIFPIEVKSGKGGTLRSLHSILAAYQNIQKGIVLYDDVERHLAEQKLAFYPLYYIHSLVHDEVTGSLQ